MVFNFVQLANIPLQSKLEIKNWKIRIKTAAAFSISNSFFQQLHSQPSHSHLLAIDLLTRLYCIRKYKIWQRAKQNTVNGENKQMKQVARFIQKSKSNV